MTTDDGAVPITGWIDARTGDGIRLVRASDPTVVPLSTEAMRRLEADSVIGFEERDDQWRRVALHRDRAGRIEVKKLNVPLTVLWMGASTALWFLP